MSKQHTPTVRKSIVIKPKNELTNSDIKEIGRVLEYHDRLVEALEKTNKALQKITLAARKDEFLLFHMKEAMKQYQEAKQLLTELKEK